MAPSAFDGVDVRSRHLQIRGPQLQLRKRRGGQLQLDVQRASSVVLVSEHYPPAIGGSGVLFENLYSRSQRSQTTVLTDESVHGSHALGAITRVDRTGIATPAWGFTSAAGLRHHARLARSIVGTVRRLGPGTSIDCGRILPEGVAGRIASLWTGAPLYCWAHGEDLATAGSSRELTLTTRWVLRGAARVFANSHNTKDVVRTFGVEESRIAVIHPGVDADRFRPDLDAQWVRDEHRVPQDAVLVLSVGRLQRRKGHDVALGAMASLKATPGRRVHYLVAGDGEERARLEQLTRELGLSECVTFAGVVEDRYLPAYFAACDVFLLPNRVERGDFEGFGIVFLEAAAAGKPVIGGASGGVAEAVADGETGILVDGANPADVAEALRAFVEDERLRATFGARGRDRAVRNFGWPAAAARLDAARQAS